MALNDYVINIQRKSHFPFFFCSLSLSLFSLLSNFYHANLIMCTFEISNCVNSIFINVLLKTCILIFKHSFIFNVYVNNIFGFCCCCCCLTFVFFLSIFSSSSSINYYLLKIFDRNVYQQAFIKLFIICLVT